MQEPSKAVSMNTETSKSELSKSGRTRRKRCRTNVSKVRYKASFSADLVKASGEGMNYVQFASQLGVAKTLLKEWARDHKEFKEAMKIAKTKVEAQWWTWINSQMGTKFNFSAWKFAMVHLLGYKELNDDTYDMEEEKENHVIILPELKKLPKIMDREEYEAKYKNGVDLESAANAGEGAEL